MIRFFRNSGFYVLFFISNVYAHECNDKFEYNITVNLDGGYYLEVLCERIIMLPKTAEGPFPKQRYNLKIKLIGKGKDWYYRKQDGYYYSLENISSKTKIWDLGYVWVNRERDEIYLNLFWVSSPDKLIPSVINGKYSIPPQKVE